MDQLEFYKDLHYREIERKDQLSDSAMNLPVTITSGMIVGLFYFFTTYSYSVNFLLKSLFLFSVSINVLLVFLVIWYLIKAYSLIAGSHAYIHNPLAKDLNIYYLQLLEYYNQNKAKADDAFCIYLKDKYIEYSSHNTTNNDEKASNIAYSRRLLVFSILVFFITSSFYGIHLLYKKEEPQKVNITNWPTINNPNVNQNSFNKFRNPGDSLQPLIKLDMPNVRIKNELKDLDSTLITKP